MPNRTKDDRRVSQHRFRWPDGKGIGTGVCRYCGLEIKFVEGEGPRGGARRHWTFGRTVQKEGDGHYLENEPPCPPR